MRDSHALAVIRSVRLVQKPCKVRILVALPLVPDIILVEIVYLLIHRICRQPGRLRCSLSAVASAVVPRPAVEVVVVCRALLQFLILTLHQSHSCWPGTTRMQALPRVVAEAASGSFGTLVRGAPCVRAPVSEILPGLVRISVKEMRKPVTLIITKRSLLSSISSSLPRGLNHHHVLQAEILVHDQSLLDVVVDAVCCDVQAVHIEEEVRLEDAIHQDRVVLSVDIDAQTVNPNVQLNALQEFPQVFV